MAAIRGVLFDLDGTLADTAPDLAYALNAVLLEQSRQALAYEQIRPNVSLGSGGLIELGFRINKQDANYEVFRQRLLDIYAEHVCDHTVLFPGMADVLTALDERALPWGIVTNKIGYLTQAVVQKLGLADRTNCVVAADSTPTPKPHPAPVLLACNLLKLAPASCLFIGDDLRDILAGRAAGTINLVARYGYLGAGEDPDQWGADGHLSKPADILDWLN